MSRTSQPVNTLRRESIPIELSQVEAGYGGKNILPALNLKIEPGQTWALIGRNGSGKSTLLRTILGLQPTVRGRVIRDDATSIAYVPQRSEYDGSVPCRVLDVVRGGIDQGWSFLKPGLWLSSKARVLAAMDETHTTELTHRQFSELSEGQKQRVLIAKALVSGPGLIVLDEPTSAMDPMAERSVFELLDRLRRERNLAILIASHTMSFVPTYATHAILVDADDQLILAGSAASVLSSPEFHERYGFIIHEEAEPRTMDLKR